ncbi:hypothetical protein [Pararhodonellum marinum]|uniref:hypothetical protein n=1 Tax=Pararhodonellum marinum TaxID=2755358 RepID=UPI00188F7619|nr:hypothetical protein [Pararhodonellum marinum]
MKSTLLLCLSLLLGIGSAQAQYFFGAGQLNYGIPTAKFRETSPQVVVPGLDLYVNYQIPKTPIELGISVGYSQYSTGVTEVVGIYDIPTQTYRERINHNLATFMGTFRFLPEVKSRTQPFFEAQAGLFMSYSRFKVRESRFEEVLDSGTSIRDTAFGRSLGGGILIPLSPKNNTYLELKVLYFRTGELEYLTQKDINYSPDYDIEFSARKSPFDMVRPSIGINIWLNE